MPRESVNPLYHADRSDVSAGPGDEGFVAMPTVEVGWMRELGEVQLGLETPSLRSLRYDGSSGQQHLVDYLYGTPETREAIGRQAWEAIVGRLRIRGMADDWATGETLDADIAQSIGRDVLDAVTGAQPGDGTVAARAHSGWYTHLDREGVNRLIRLLRKARDAAFGKDE